MLSHCSPLRCSEGKIIIKIIASLTWQLECDVYLNYFAFPSMACTTLCYAIALAKYAVYYI